MVYITNIYCPNFAGSTGNKPQNTASHLKIFVQVKYHDGEWCTIMIKKSNLCWYVKEQHWNVNVKYMHFNAQAARLGYEQSQCQPLPVNKRFNAAFLSCTVILYSCNIFGINDFTRKTGNISQITSTFKVELLTQASQAIY